jgi:hypothetical protein
MIRKTPATLAIMALMASGTPVFAKEPVPVHVHQCVTTSVKAIGTRLEGIPGSGSAITYTNGLYQVSYDIDMGMQSSRPGDKVYLCLTELPAGCPPGDDRGKVYKATNLRTNRAWEASDSEHSCGGA